MQMGQIKLATVEITVMSVHLGSSVWTNRHIQNSGYAFNETKLYQGSQGKIRNFSLDLMRFIVVMYIGKIYNDSK